MFDKSKKTMLVAALLICGIRSALAVSVDVNISGTVIPTACTPTLSGGGVIDYGSIRANTLSADAYTVLPEMKLDFAINCDAPARVAIHAVNDRPGTMAGVTEAANGVAPVPAAIFGGSAGMFDGVGLGMDGTTRIGGYGMHIRMSSVMADGVGVVTLISDSTDGSAAWNGSPAGGVYHTTPRIISWGATGSTTPTAFQTLTGSISVQAYINRASELDLSHSVNLDGQTTLELVYL